MNDRTPQRRIVFCGAVIVVGLLTSAALTSMGRAQNGVTNRGVVQRMATMGVAKTAVGTLTDMVAGRVRFDRKVARAAREDLIGATKQIPKVFKRRHGDRLSPASPNIWIRWEDFETRADIAERAARRLRVDRLGLLQKTLPDMINACLNCHQIYRIPR